MSLVQLLVASWHAKESADSVANVVVGLMKQLVAPKAFGDLRRKGVHVHVHVCVGHDKKQVLAVNDEIARKHLHVVIVLSDQVQGG